MTVFPSLLLLALVTGWNVERAEFLPGSASDPLCDLPSLGLSFPVYTKKEIDELGRKLPTQSVISVGSLYKHVSHSF